MCDDEAIEFVLRQLPERAVVDRAILEVGAYDVNGTARPALERLSPSEYTGIDITEGPGVDVVLAVEDAEKAFGPDRFDVIVCTEVVEHILDWRIAFQSMKSMLRSGGRIVLTTRSRGFQYHGFPNDFWRYEPSDMKLIFSDFTEVAIETDSRWPGVFVAAKKPEGWAPQSLDAIALYSVLARRRIRNMRPAPAKILTAGARVWRASPEPLVSVLRRVMPPA